MVVEVESWPHEGQKENQQIEGREKNFNQNNER